MLKLKKNKSSQHSPGDKAKSNLRLLKAETAQIMRQMGVSATFNSWRSLPVALHQLSLNNKTPVIFVRNLDNATYEIRERLKWNSKMATRLVMTKIRQNMRLCKRPSKS